MQSLLLGNVSDMMMAGSVSFRKSFKSEIGCFGATNPLGAALIVLREVICDLSRAVKSRDRNEFPPTRAEMIFGQCVRATCISKKI